METAIPRRRRARVLSLGAAIALVALLLPATAGIALGHTASATCDQISNDPSATYGPAVAHQIGTGMTFDIPAAGVAIVPAGSYWVEWTDDGYTQGLPNSQDGQTDPIVVGQCTPSISTVASATTGTVGVAGTVGDTATLSAPVKFDSGTAVTFTLYSDSECSDSAGVTGTANLNEDGVATFSQGWTPSAAGTYYWGVSFPSDTYNSAVSACGGEAETVVVSNPPPTSPPCTAANNCYVNTPSPSPSASPSVSPSPSASPSPSPTPTSAVEAATSKPHITPPPTSSLGGTTGSPSSGLWLLFLALAGLLGSILLLTPAPARARRKR